MSVVVRLDDYRPAPIGSLLDSRRVGEAGKATPPAGSLPARLHPRPVRTVARRMGRSQAAADLRDAAFVIGLLLATLLALTWLDPTTQDLLHLINGDPR